MPSVFYLRFTPALAKVLKVVLLEVLEQVSQRAGAPAIFSARTCMGMAHFEHLRLEYPHLDYAEQRAGKCSPS